MVTRAAAAAAALAAAIAAAGCGSAPPGDEAGPRAPAPRKAASGAGATAAAARPEVTFTPQEPAAVPGLGPEILLPDPSGQDDEVARVGDLVLKKSHAFTRLLSYNPKIALDAVDLLVFDVLVARHATQFGIRVQEERVLKLAQAEEDQLRAQVKAEHGESAEFGSFVWRIFGMRLQDWRRTTQLRTAQRLYQGYVIRYLALREDRVQVRYVVHKDKKVVDEIAVKVREGADFATLALRHSEDSFRRDGGLLPPFGPGFPHAAADVAFTLQKGELAAPFAKETNGETRWYLVYCLDRMKGREAAFADVRDEIDKDLEKRPLAPIEMNAYTLRWRGQLELLAAPDAPRDAPAAPRDAPQVPRKER